MKTYRNTDLIKGAAYTSKIPSDDMVKLEKNFTIDSIDADGAIGTIHFVGTVDGAPATVADVKECFDMVDEFLAYRGFKKPEVQ